MGLKVLLPITINQEIRIELKFLAKYSWKSLGFNYYIFYNQIVFFQLNFKLY